MSTVRSRNFMAIASSLCAGNIKFIFLKENRLADLDFAFSGVPQYSM